MHERERLVLRGAVGERPGALEGDARLLGVDAREAHDERPLDVLRVGGGDGLVVHLLDEEVGQLLVGGGPGDLAGGCVARLGVAGGLELEVCDRLAYLLRTE